MTTSVASIPVAGGLTAERFRATMRNHASGVAVITTQGRRPIGFCATSLTSISLDPPTVSFAVATGSLSGRAWAEAQFGLVHLLRADQAHVAAAFARSGPASPGRFGGSAGWQPGPAGQPLLDGVLAWMLIRTRERLAVADHLLVIADVLQTGEQPGLGPLLHHAGGYHALPDMPPNS